LGASRRQVVRIMIVEYLFLGFFAALTGLVLSFASGWGFAALVFETTYRPDLSAVVAMLVVVPVLTVAIGLISGRGIYKRPPLDVLRADV
ncbi:MAG: FtsX-like permease family protein, partial [Rhodothermales bacterium]